MASAAFPEFDLVVVGGGPVGASLARAATGLSVALVAASAPSGPAPGAPGRVYAISPANAAFLRRLGAWGLIGAGHCTPVHAMRVFGDAARARLDFDAYRAGVPELAWIVDESALQEALWRSLEASGAARLIAPAQCERIEWSEEGARLRLREGGELRAKLVAGADGARSFVREQAGVAAEEHGYGQTAVVAHFDCERAHGNVAYQWFQGGPVLALLPMAGDRVSMVWSVASAEAERLLRLAPAELCAELEAASKGVLGGFALRSAPRGFALRRLRAARLVAPRVALLGDAAHVVHPLAGQGANLGLQDAQALAGVLAAREPGRDPGELRLLRRYERARAEPVWEMTTLVDGLHRLFGARAGAAGLLRNAGLAAVDRLAVVKNLLIRQAMG